MNNTTQPIENIIQFNKELYLKYIEEYSKVRTHIGYETSLVQSLKNILGKQDYCCLGKYRYWVWEREQFRILVSNKKGLCFEVFHSLNAKEAFLEWCKFCSLVGYSD